MLWSVHPSVAFSDSFPCARWRHMRITISRALHSIGGSVVGYAHIQMLSTGGWAYYFTSRYLGVKRIASIVEVVTLLSGDAYSLPAPLLSDKVEPLQKATKGIIVLTIFTHFLIYFALVLESLLVAVSELILFAPIVVWILNYCWLVLV